MDRPQRAEEEEEVAGMELELGGFELPPDATGERFRAELPAGRRPSGRKQNSTQVTSRGSDRLDLGSEY